ncbi:MAG: hypothetical protein LC772_06615 [Chloroflexi bacterium]|nr:hypothetical protein [Chloroflexota bacterium]
MERVSGKGSIEDMALLTDGWDSYEAPAPNLIARSLAEETLRLLVEAGFEPDRVAPSAEGGVAFSWRRANGDANVEFFNDGEVLMGIHRKGHEPEVRVLIDEAGMRRAFSDIREYMNDEHE